VLQGTVRKAGDRLRVSAQLVDASSGKQVWSQKYDRNLSASDVFDVEDEIREQIVATISDVHGIIYSAGLGEARSRPTESLSAQECVYVALAYDKSLSSENHLRARESLERAVELDPEYALAWGYLSWIYTDEYIYGFNPLPDSMPRALEAARRSVELAPTNHINRWLLARVYFFRRELSQFFAEAEKSLKLNSNEGTTLGLIGVYTALGGKWDRGLALMRKATELNPHYPGYYHLVFGAAHLREGRYEEALLEYEKMALPGWFLAQIPLVAVNGHLGRNKEMEAAMAHLLELRPGYDLEKCAEDLHRFGLPEDVVEPLLEGLKMAGLS
jgi:tetratricopeptide (TPR) repeat protein